ncbi:MAG: NHL repeat-containing protein [Pseudomonadota bacterium]
MNSTTRGLARLTIGAVCVALASCIPYTLDPADPGIDGAIRIGLLSLIAGDIGGAGTLDAVGTAARFYGPNAVATDASGNLYVADSYNHTIRKVVIATGVVTTLAGTAGSSGSADGNGALARFQEPSGIAADAFGNLYVADKGNHTIRQIVIATAAVTTLAGTAGSSGSTDATGAAALFQRPRGVAADAAGNLYVTDTDNFTIRKIVIATGAVTTLAGTAGGFGSTNGIGAAARFAYPDGIAVDAGNLYVAETGNQTIRKIVIATRVVSTFAGTTGVFGDADGIGGAANFRNPGGLAADASGNLYVADTLSHTIRKIVITTAEVTTLAGTGNMSGSADGTGAAARFSYPGGVAADASGNVYVADTFNYTIRKMVAGTGAVSTLAGLTSRLGSIDGTGAAAVFQGPNGITADGAGNLYVADFNNHTIRKITPDGVVSTLAGTAGSSGTADGTGAAARFMLPVGVMTDGSGNLYVADTYNSLIRKIVIATGEVSTITDFTAQLLFPHGIVADGAGKLFVADTANNTIRQIVIATGVVSTLAGTAGGFGSADGTGAAAQFSGPRGITLDGSGDLYVADANNNTIRKIVIATGEVSTPLGTAGSPGSTDGIGVAARFQYPSGITTDAAGNLYIADMGNHTIRQIAIATGVVTTIAGVAGQQGILLGALPGSLSAPSFLTFIDHNTLALSSGGSVLRLALP